ncbi:MAG: TonB-dependent receptor [Alphaproteobacteria bacterium]|nr:TonB-dependent receptor [Alphaproteobacteria bacterium]
MKKTIAMLGTASVLALAAATAAHAGSVSGRVSDASMTIGLQGATIRVLETGASAVAGRDGAFRIAGLPAGQYTLRVNYVGADARDITITIPSDDANVNTDVVMGDDVAFRENILVIGQRGAINSALSRQRADDGVVTVLSSDAIGQFPDENVAEAARRAVGVNVLNDQGEGRFVSIRGLDPNLVSTSINGVRLTSPEAEDRQVGLDVIDADVLSSVVINKTLLPNMDADSVGGNVEIETMSGLDSDGLYLRGRVATLFSNLEDSFGYRGSINFANSFMNDQLGVAGSLSYQEREFGSESYEVDGGWDEDNGIYFPNEVEMRNYEITRERLTAVLNFDYDYSDNLSFYWRNTYSDFSDQEYRSRVELKLEDARFDSTNSTAILPVFVADSNDPLEIDRDIKDRLETQMIFATDIGGEYLMGDTTFDWSLSYTYAEEEEPNRLDTDFRAEFDSNEVLGVNTAAGDIPQLVYQGGATTQNIFNSSNYENNGFELTNGLAQDREYAGSFNVRHDFALASGAAYIQTGLRFRSRDKKFELDMEVYDDASNLSLADVENFVEYTQDRQGPVPSAGQTRDWFNANRASLSLEVEDSLIENLGSSYSFSEDVMAGYLMAGWESGPVRIVGGVRIEDTDIEARGTEVLIAEENSVVSGGVTLSDDAVFFTPIRAEDEYTDVLPSILARFEARENLIFRLGYYASIQRANPGQFAPRVLVEQNDNNEFEGEFGNPDLNHLEADNYDISVEWYPNNDSVVSLGYFFKELENVIAPIEYSNITLQGRLFDEASSFINLPDGEVSGWEFNYQQGLDDYLPFDGVIAGFNVTWANSDATLSDGRVIPLPRQSDVVWNAVLGYDQGPWDLRAVVSHRDEYLDEIRGDAGSDRIVLEHTQLDLSAKYNFNDTLQIFADIKNVTDEPYHAVTRPDGLNRVEQFEEYGWSTVFGIRVTY